MFSSYPETYDPILDSFQNFQLRARIFIAKN